nr:unnamed protein product [Meloidogyne enterolobii]
MKTAVLRDELEDDEAGFENAKTAVPGEGSGATKTAAAPDAKESSVEDKEGRGGGAKTAISGDDTTGEAKTDEKKENEEEKKEGKEEAAEGEEGSEE